MKSENKALNAPLEKKRNERDQLKEDLKQFSGVINYYLNIA